jgi:DNA-binding protein Fis
VVEACGGNRRKAAEILGLSVVTLWRKSKREDEKEAEGPIGQ